MSSAHFTYFLCSLTFHNTMGVKSRLLMLEGGGLAIIGTKESTHALWENFHPMPMVVIASSVEVQCVNQWKLLLIFVFLYFRNYQSSLKLQKVQPNLMKIISLMDVVKMNVQKVMACLISWTTFTGILSLIKNFIVDTALFVLWYNLVKWLILLANAKSKQVVQYKTS